MNHKFVSGICGSFAAVLAMTLTIQAPPQQGGGGGFGGGGFGGGIAGEIKNGEEVTQKLILTPGQPSEWELDIKSGDTIFVTVTTTNFDPEAQIVDAEGNVLAENDDIVLGDQRSRLVYTFDKEGKYKILVD
jgi:hypothetical protein